MTMKKITLSQLLAGLVVGSVCWTAVAQTADPQVQAVLKSSFRAEGIAKLDRIEQDENQALCSDAKFRDSPAGQAKLVALQNASLAKIKPPSDGKYLGDWKEGEKIAQSGRGATWSDSATAANGGSCYNCHQLDKKEISFGNIGPSLTGYGKTRGTGQEILVYTWNRVNNSKAYNACSNMPRFAHFELLTEKQIKDVMALLLDPKSPVNE